MMTWWTNGHSGNGWRTPMYSKKNICNSANLRAAPALPPSPPPYRAATLPLPPTRGKPPHLLPVPALLRPVWVFGHSAQAAGHLPHPQLFQSLKWLRHSRLVLRLVRLLARQWALLDGQGRGQAAPGLSQQVVEGSLGLLVVAWRQIRIKASKLGKKYHFLHLPKSFFFPSKLLLRCPISQL